MTDVVTQAIIRLFDQERFYAELVLSMDRIISKRIPTAGVSIQDTIKLYVNPDFFAKLTNEEQVAVLKHECMHILNDHIPRAKELAPEIYSKNSEVVDGLINQSKHALINISADCAINPAIPNIPEGAQMPEKFDLKIGERMEWYVEHLKDNEKLKELTSYDGHSLWSESEGDKEELRAKIKKAINAAASRTKAAGNMTSDIELLIDRLNYTPRNWKQDLNRFAARSINQVKESTKKRRNRRYGIMFPGDVKREELHIGVAVDTSGSISDIQLNQFMAEVGNIAKYARVTVVEADSEVKNSYVFDRKRQYKVSGRGGTAYQPAFDYFANETDVDGVIYFGDMDCADNDNLKKPSFPVLWAVVGHQEPPAKWGSRTKVEINEKSKI